MSTHQKEEGAGQGAFSYRITTANIAATRGRVTPEAIGNSVASRIADLLAAVELAHLLPVARAALPPLQVERLGFALIAWRLKRGCR